MQHALADRGNTNSGFSVQAFNFDQNLYTIVLKFSKILKL